MVIKYEKDGIRDDYRWQDGVDILAFPFGAAGEIDIKRESLGKSEKLKKIKELSKGGGIVMCGGKIKGVLSANGVVVAEGGKLCGIAEETHSFSHSQTGGILSLCSFRGKKTGIVVGDDVFFYEALLPLSRCGAQSLLCFVDSVIEKRAKTALRGFAVCEGLPVVLFCSSLVLFTPEGEEKKGENGKITLPDCRAFCTYCSRKR